jgi:choline-sulfatase
MIRQGAFKYVHYVGYESQLFDLARDPDEVCDLVDAPDHREIREALHAALLQVVDPQDVDRRAKENQALQGIARARQI